MCLILLYRQKWLFRKLKQYPRISVCVFIEDESLFLRFVSLPISYTPGLLVTSSTEINLERKYLILK